MHEVARAAMVKLLAMAENAMAKRGATGGSERSLSIRFSEARFPAYLRLPSHAQKQAYHGELRLAEEVGAIRIVWNARAGEHHQIEKIELLDGDRLANHLGTPPRWKLVEQADAALQAHMALHAVLGEVIERWRAGLGVRGLAQRRLGNGSMPSR